MQFIRHIQRTSILLFLIDVQSEHPVEDYRTLRAELYLFDPFMDRKSHLIALSKLDVIEEDERDQTVKDIIASFRKEFGEEILGISAVSGYHIPELKRKLYTLLEKDKQA